MTEVKQPAEVDFDTLMALVFRSVISMLIWLSMSRCASFAGCAEAAMGMMSDV